MTRHLSKLSEEQYESQYIYMYIVISTNINACKKYIVVKYYIWHCFNRTYLINRIFIWIGSDKYSRNGISLSNKTINKINNNTNNTSQIEVLWITEKWTLTKGFKLNKITIINAWHFIAV